MGLTKNSAQQSYAAFISYRHTYPDINIAKYLHTLLETYRIPVSIALKYGSKRLGKVFRDQEELPVSENLSRDIINALESSKFLIVVCSPNTPLSKWCAREIELFKKMHGNSRILTLLIDGDPDVSFPQALKTVSDDNNENETDAPSVVEPLAADIRADNLQSMIKQLKKYEVLRLIAPMLGVSFDTLRQRERERVRKKLFRYTAAGLLLASVLGVFAGLSLNRIQAEQERAKLASKQAEVEHARAETLVVENELAKAKADAEIEHQVQKAETERLRAEAENQRAIAEHQRAELEAQKAEAERLRAEDQQKRADDLTTSSRLTDLLVEAQGDLVEGWRISAMEKAAKVIKGYLKSWAGYDMVQRAAELVLQRAGFQPAFTGIGTITHSTDPGRKVFLSYITKDESTLLSFNNGSKSFELWDIKSGKLLHTTSIGQQIADMFVEEESGLLIYVLSFNYGFGVLDIENGNILYTLQPDLKYKEIFGNRAMISDIYRAKDGTYQFLVNKDGRGAFLLTYSLKPGSISVSEVAEKDEFLSDAKGLVKLAGVGISNRLNCTVTKTPDGNLNNIAIRNEEGTVIREFLLDAPIYEVSAQVTSDERYMAAWCSDFEETFVYVYDLKSTSSEPSIERNISDAYCAMPCIVPVQNILVMPGERRLTLMDANTGYIRTYKYDGEVNTCTLSPKGNILAVSYDNVTTFMTCRTQTLYPVLHSPEETIKNAGYTVGVFSGALEQYSASSGDYYATRDRFNRKYIEIFKGTGDKPVARFLSPDEISCFTLDPSSHRLYIYSWRLGMVLVWDWNQNKFLTELAMPCSLGSVSIQPSGRKNRLYMANGFTIYQIDLNTKEITMTTRLDEDKRSTLLSAAYIFDEKNDRVYVVSGDEEGSESLQTVYGVYQLSTGEKICGEMLADSPLNNTSILGLSFCEASGVALFSLEKDHNRVVGNVYLPPLKKLLEFISQ